MNSRIGYRFDSIDRPVPGKLPEQNGYLSFSCRIANRRQLDERTKAPLPLEEPEFQNRLVPIELLGCRAGSKASFLPHL